MAITSPDNIRTPDPGDPFNLVPDLQTLAQDVQDALIARGNVFRGTAAQRAAFLSTASPGMLWQDTDGIGMLWKRGASQWVPAVWRWSGTTAQMNGFTQAPDGFEWFNTTSNSEYLRISGAWVSTSMRSGVATIPAGSWSSSTAPFYGRSASVTLPVVLSSNETILVGSANRGSSGFDFVSLNTVTKNPSNTEINMRLVRFNNAATTSFTFPWMVINE